VILIRRSIDQEIENFVNSISDMWKDEPLDGDETIEIANKVLGELDHRNGNDERGIDKDGSLIWK